MSNIIYKKGDQVTCTNGHKIGTISRDINFADMAQSDDIVNDSGDPLFEQCSHPSEDDCKCKVCGAWFISHFKGAGLEYCINGKWANRVKDKNE